MNDQQVETENIETTEQSNFEDLREQIESEKISDPSTQTIEEKLTAELAASEARVLRAYADFDNERDKFIHSLLGVADNLRRALRLDKDESSPYRDGLLSVMRNIDNILKDFGAEQIPAEKGLQMDPHLHEAVTTLSVPGVEHGSIIEVAEPGYVIGERVVRPAKVIVAKAEDE
jgi:molecular chaperone GrpE